MFGEQFRTNKKKSRTFFLHIFPANIRCTQHFCDEIVFCAVNGEKKSLLWNNFINIWRPKFNLIEMIFCWIRNIRIGQQSTVHFSTFHRWINVVLFPSFAACHMRISFYFCSVYSADTHIHLYEEKNINDEIYSH